MFKIYMRDGCGYCTLAKQLLEQKNIKYKEINVWEDESAMSFLQGQDLRTVPQIYTDKGIHIGGYMELQERIHEIN